MHKFVSTVMTDMSEDIICLKDGMVILIHHKDGKTLVDLFTDRDYQMGLNPIKSMSYHNEEPE